ncbi:GH22569 [Drosophila grimshawi]|uniref:GH22569 n=1 Tax=Drosophila grimshawi TaxID=7222 RepID=B4K1Z5_DROGR|nr:GH22569 [Drosophila grimshawi]
MFTSKHLGLALIQEPWVNNVIKGLFIADSKVIWDGRDPAPRACMMVRKSINFTILSEFLTRDCVPILVYTKGIVSAYFAKYTPCPQPEEENLVEYCRKEKIPVLIGCDANAHHTIWGGSDINLRGRNPRKTNWEGYKSTLELSLANRLSSTARNPLELDRATGELNKCLIGAFEGNCPVAKKFMEKDASWNDSLERLCVTIRRLFNKPPRVI